MFDGKEEFLCLELKNSINGKRNLLSAFCQATHRAVEFHKGFDPEKLQSAHIQCMSEAIPERGGAAANHQTFKFPPTPKTKRIVAAVDFPDDAQFLYNTWSSMDKQTLDTEVKQYAPSKEFNRFLAVEEANFGIIANTQAEITRINLKHPLEG